MHGKAIEFPSVDTFKIEFYKDLSNIVYVSNYGLEKEVGLQAS